jgi:hypothetical protein
MKSIFFKLFLTVLIFNLTGCVNFLEEEVESYYNNQQVFSSNEGIEAAVNGLYAKFADPAYYGTAMHTFINPISGTISIPIKRPVLMPIVSKLYTYQYMVDPYVA